MCVEGEVKDIATVVKSAGVGRGSDEESFLEPEGCGASEIVDLLEDAEKVRGTGFFWVFEDSPSLRVFFFVF